MEKYLGYAEKELHELSAFWTAKEISQQPSSWLKTVDLISDASDDIQTLLTKIDAYSDLRIILTGAGTSAFAGESIAPALTEKLKRRIEAISTTDLVGNPKQYFSENIPTLLVSFARSGNSPESLAAVELADQCLSNCFHLILTCNAEGKLYQQCQGNKNALALLMPEETNDQSFAMTSSFSCMLLAAVLVLSYKTPFLTDMKNISAVSSVLLETMHENITETATYDHKRVIYLGSGGFKGLARESALKLLELTAGQVVACYDSPLGFRHGPKSIVDETTFIVVFISNDPYTRLYDLDLLAELRKDARASKVLAITAQKDDSVTDGEYIYVPNMQQAGDVELLFPYMLFAQAYSFHRAIAIKNSPDKPCPSGEVNRVVQGVTIHSL
ncbi:tagatose-6-phosphate ketose/aldose isomerase [Psychromonas sp. CNPT3]|uniref:SIS domain-containing protein n=1 Tax=Psychromonas sp. CNPT3 TaxID=314282 RepID=UPI0002C149CD|nr:SIS domain-containing protein [Psychromonas sp. CNPT3]AGH82006.1 tagatose-6-phosphate ketose/aldose isomerase [Psychromonas sp. CNPT3]